MACTLAVACGTAPSTGANGGAFDWGTSGQDGAQIDAARRVDDSTHEPDAATHPDAQACSDPLASFTLSPLVLAPAFSPSVHDYYVRCAPGTNVVAISMTAAPRGAVGLLEPIRTAPTPSQSFGVDLRGGDALVVDATCGSTSASYWVRCLPNDFPEFTMRAHPAAGTPVPGYYLLGDSRSATGEGAYAMVLDGNGVPVWYSTTQTGRQPFNVDSVATNVISFVPFFAYTFAATSGAYELHDLGSSGLRFVEPPTEPLDVHELQQLPNGDHLVLSDPILGGVDLTGLPGFGADSSMLGCDVQELDATGAVVWKWSAVDHFDPVRDSTWPQTWIVSATPVADPFHCNSIDVAPNGDLLLSARHMDSIFLVSRSTGAVEWKMGGSTYTKDGAAYLAVDGDPLTSFYRQHDARFLPGNQISLFDDHTNMPGPARALIYSYDVDAGTASWEWEYRGKLPVTQWGSFRVLPDGSRIIGWGDGGEPTLGFTEVDASGHDLLDFYFNDGDQSYRAVKVPLSQLDLDMMRRTAGQTGEPVAGQGDAGVDSAADGRAADATTLAVPVGCHVLSGSGSSLECQYRSSSASGFTCTSFAGSTPGSCPAAGLYGCCVDTPTVDGGGSSVSATCYYSATAGQPASSQCAFEAYQALTYDWQTYAP